MTQKSLSPANADNKESTSAAKPKRSRKQVRQPAMIALEPRVLFDGAALATAVDTQQATDAAVTGDNVLPTDANLTPEFAAAIASLANASDTPVAIDAGQIDAVASLTGAVDSSVALNQPAGAGRNELVVIDGGLDDLQTLIDDINRIDPNRIILVLDPANSAQGESAQLTSYLEQHAGQYDAIHVLSHGGDGWISLGEQTLRLDTPEQNAQLWNSVKTALTAQGDLLLYGCNVASDATGQNAINALAGITDADIAASTDITGQSGDWALEATSGSIETQIIEANRYQGDLGAYTAAPSVNSILVNEGTGPTVNYAVFTVNGEPTSKVNLALTAGSATSSSDYSTTIQYWNGTAWTTGSSAVVIGSSGVLLVRIGITADTLNEGAETFTLKATYSATTGVVTLNGFGIGTATIMDDGTGTLYTSANPTNGVPATTTQPTATVVLAADAATLANDDRPLTVDSPLVNEGSYAVFTVGGKEGQYVKLALGNTTVTTDVDASLVNDLTNALEYWNGSAWTAYTTGSFVQIPGDGDGTAAEAANLLVRVAITNDSTMETPAGETFTLTATNTGTGATTGIATIRDNGTGTLFATSSTATGVAPATASTPATAIVDTTTPLDDDRLVQISNVTVDETSPYIVYSVKSVASQTVKLTLASNGTGAGFATIGTDTAAAATTTTTKLEYWNGTTWVAWPTTGLAMTAGQTLSVRAAIVSDTTVEGAETFLLKATDTSATPVALGQGIGTIVEDGTGTTFAKIEIDAVNECSPYAVFTIDRAYGKQVKFSLVTTGTGAGFATLGTTANDDVLSNTLQYWDATATGGQGAWVDYNTGDVANVPADDDLLVRVKINDQEAYEGPETFGLKVTDTIGNLMGYGVATIMDNGTGTIYTGAAKLPIPPDASAAYRAATTDAEKAAALQAWRDLSFEKSRFVIASFHGAFYKAEGGGYYVSGEKASPTGSGLTTPLLVTPANGYDYAGKIIDVTAVAGASQYAILTTAGLYVWGAEGRLLPAGLTTSVAFQQIALPTDFVPTDVKYMSASDGGMVFLMNDGTVRSVVIDASQQTGHTGYPDFSQVRNSSGAILQNITDIEFANNTAFAYSAIDNQFYTWGTSTYLGDGSAMTSRATATIMASPLPGGVSVVQIGVGTSSYYVLGSDGRIYTMGENVYGQLGQGSTTDIAAWTTVKGTAGGNTILENVQFISAQNGTASLQAAGAILADGSLVAWGSNSAYMLGTTGTNTYTPQLVRGSVNGEQVFTVETGGHFSVALLYGCSGEVNATGHNPGGAFGDGTTTDRTLYTTNMFLGDLAGTCVSAIVDETAPLCDDTGVAINDVTVNESSPYAMFTIDVTGSQTLKLALAATTNATNNATLGTDTGTALEYWDGAGWVAYNPATGVNVTAGQELLVRVAIVKDTVADPKETFKLSILDSNGNEMKSGLGTILETGGDVILAAEVSSAIVNECSPYAVLMVDNIYGQQVRLALSGTRRSSTATAGTPGVDTGIIEYWDTTANGGKGAWVAYVADSVITAPSSDDLAVRIVINEDVIYEGAEGLTLLVKDSTGTSTLGMGGIVIKDDGTGDIYAGTLDITPIDASAAYAAATTPAEKQAALQAWRDLNFEKSRYIVASFHGALYKAENGGYYVSGEYAGPTGGNLTKPLLVSPENGYNYTGEIIDVAAVATNGQYALLTTEGLWVWGYEGRLLPDTLTTSWAFQKITTLPFSPTDVKYMSASDNGIMFLMKDGTVRAVTDGYFGNSVNYSFTPVLDASRNALSHITDIEYGNDFAFAYSATDNKFYTWGATTYLGDGSAALKRPAATEMINPLPAGVSVVQLGVSYNTYFVLGSDGKIYTMGYNIHGQAGQNSTTAVTTWATVRDTTGAAGTSLTNVQYISANNGTYGQGAITVILKDGSLLAWGSDSLGMLGIPVPSSGRVLKPTAPTGSVVGQPVFTVETGGHFTVAMFYGCEGEINAVGHNPGGAFGDGTTTDRSSYVTTQFMGDLGGTCSTPALISPAVHCMDDDRPVSITSVTVNEASPYAVFKLTGYERQEFALSLQSGTATAGVDFNQQKIQYWNPAANSGAGAWVDYTPGSGAMLEFPTNGDGTVAEVAEMLIRVAIIQDAPFENSESFQVQVLRDDDLAPGGLTQVATGTGTILDNGTGALYSGTDPAAYLAAPVNGQTAGAETVGTNGLPATLDNDRAGSPLVSSVTVNEASPFAVFTVDALPGSHVALALRSTGSGAGNASLTGGGADIGQALEYYDGANWVSYSAATPVTVGSDGRVLVRVALVNDTAFENAETFNLTATYADNTAGATAGGVGTGTGTIVDDGTGVIFVTTAGASGGGVTAGSGSTPSEPTLATPGQNDAPALNDDRGASPAVSNVTVNEGSPYSVMTVSGLPGSRMSLALSAGGTASAGSDYTNAIEVWDAAANGGAGAWVPYNSSTGVTLPADGHVLARVAILNDTSNEGAETFNLTATYTAGTGVTIGGSGTGSTTIVDDGTGLLFVADNPNVLGDQSAPALVNGELTAPTVTPPVGSQVTPSASMPLANDDRPVTVGDVSVNEASPYAVMTVTAKEGQYVKLDLSAVSATAGGANSDYTPTLEYFDPAANSGAGGWVTYTAGSFVKVPGDGDTTTGETANLLVRVAITNDTLSDNGETFKLTAYNTTGAANVADSNGDGTCTIKDDGTGTIFATSSTNLGIVPATPSDPTSAVMVATVDPATTPVVDPATSPKPMLNDDRPLTIAPVTVNEGSPYAVFTVGGTEGQYVKLALGSGTATVGTDTGTTLEYWNGSSWAVYTPGTFVQIPSDNTSPTGEAANLLVRVAIVNDAPSDNGETFTLTATNTGGVDTLGSGTIKDDGTGTVFATTTSGTTGVASPAGSPATAETVAPVALVNGVVPAANAGLALNDDRPLTVAAQAPMVNEASPYAMFTVSGAPGQLASLSLPTNTSAPLTAVEFWNGSTWVPYTAGDLVPLDANGKLPVRVLLGPEQDTSVDNSEPFSLTASNTDGAAATPAMVTIMDDGTGTVFVADDPSTPGVDESAPTYVSASGSFTAPVVATGTANVVNPTTTPLANDDRPVTVGDVSVNEGSPYAVFTVGAVEGQYVKLELGTGTATAGADYAASLEYFDGTSWVAYTPGTFVKVPTDGDGTPGEAANLLVRVAIKNDTVSDNGETFTLTASNSNNTGATGTATIKDDGTGTVFATRADDPAVAGDQAVLGVTTPSNPGSPITATTVAPATGAVVDPATSSATLANDDTPLTVSSPTVNEASPYMVFSVTGGAGQYVQLLLASDTATVGIDTANAGTRVPLQYFDGTNWVDYTPGAFVQMPNNGTTLLVRTAVTQDTTYEMAETLKLTANNTGGGGAVGVGTIKDDGTGSVFLAANNTATPNVLSDTGYPTLDDDRPANPAFVNDVLVNEASPFAVMTVSGVPGAKVFLTVGPDTATQGASGTAISSTDYTASLKYFNGTSWVDYDAANPPTLPANTNGALLVRVPVLPDNVLDGGERIMLKANYDVANPPNGVTLSNALFTGYAKIVDDGTGAIFPDATPTGVGTTSLAAATTPTATSDVVLAANVGTLADDDRPVTVNNVSVNEASPYAVMTVTAKEGQYVKLDLSAVSATAGGANSDYTPTLEYFDPAANSGAGGWVTYTAGSFVKVPGDGDTTTGETANLLVRVAITNDTLSDNGETFKLTAYNTSGAANVPAGNGDTGIATIKDDGTGTIFATSSTNLGITPATPSDPTSAVTVATVDPATTLVVDPATSPKPLLNDDRPLTIAPVTVNEGSPYAVFTVGGTEGQYVKLALGSGTATVGTDTGTTLEYWNGSNWAVYTPGTFVQIPSDNTSPTGEAANLLVRVAIVNDAPSDNGETFTLTATNTGGVDTVGSGTIKDDGTGTVFATTTSGATGVASPAGSPATAETVAPVALVNGVVPAANAALALNDDRPLTVAAQAPTVNEASPYAMFTVSGAPGQLASLSLPTNTSAPLTAVEFWNGSTWVPYTAGDLVPLDANGKLPVRVLLGPEQDTSVDNSEPFSLTASNTDGAAATPATVTIMDDGTGTVFVADVSGSPADESAPTYASGSFTAPVVTPTTAPVASTPAAIDALPNDDRALSVDSLFVNEGSPYAVFTVTGGVNQYVQLALGNTASTADVNATLNTDTGNAGSAVPLQYYNGSTWVDYVPGSFVQIPGGGTTLLVRTAIVNDDPLEGPETFTLTATNTGGTTPAEGTATITDDGTGDLYGPDNVNGLADQPGANGAPDTLDDDRPVLSITNVSVNETMDRYAVMSVLLSRPSNGTVIFTPTMVATTNAANNATLGTDTVGTAIEVSYDGGTTWTSAAGGVTIPAGDTSVLLRSEIKQNDGVAEQAETYAIETGHITGTGFVLNDDGVSGTVTIVDPPTLSVGSTTVNEGSPYAVVTVSLSTPAVGSPVVFTPSLGNATGTVGTDTGTAIEYWTGTAWVSAASGVTIPVGASSVLLRTSIVRDTDSETSEVVNIVTGAVTGSVQNPGGAGGTITITDDGTGILLLADDPVTPTVDESAPGVVGGVLTAPELTPTTPVMNGSVGVVLAANAPTLPDDDRPLLVNDVTVNEGSPFAVFTVTGEPDQFVKLALAPTTNASGNASLTGANADIAQTLQFFNGTTWVDYVPGSFVQIPATSYGELLVRVAVVNDTPLEAFGGVGETFTLVATNTGGTDATGTGTIMDDGTGDLFGAANSTGYPDAVGSAADLPAVLDDDRPFTVDSVTVNEASPYAVFTVGGVEGQLVQLALGSGTATVGTDTGTALEVWNGTAWVPYVAGSFVEIPANGNGMTGEPGSLLVRVAIVNDAPFENSERFTLTATNTGGQPAVGTGTIKDDGTGTLFSALNSTGLPDAIGSAADLPTVLNDDRPAAQNSTLIYAANHYNAGQAQGVYHYHRPWERRWEEKPIELGTYEFHKIVLDFNGVHGGINQFSVPHVESTMARGQLEHSNHTPYAYFDRVDDEVRNAQRSVDAKLAVMKLPVSGEPNLAASSDTAPNDDKVAYREPAAKLAKGQVDGQKRVTPEAKKLGLKGKPSFSKQVMNAVRLRA